MKQLKSRDESIESFLCCSKCCSIFFIFLYQKALKINSNYINIFVVSSRYGNVGVKATDVKCTGAGKGKLFRKLKEAVDWCSSSFVVFVFTLHILVMAIEKDLRWIFFWKSRKSISNRKVYWNSSSLFTWFVGYNNYQTKKSN